VLEDRRLLTQTVTTNADSGLGSLRAALAAAAPGELVNFAPTLTGGQTITLASTLAITQNVVISAAGVTPVTVSGNNAVTVFSFSAAVTSATIDSLTIANGLGNLGSGSDGGGIFNSGTLTLQNSTLSGNGADGDGGGIYNAAGATLHVQSTTISYNPAVKAVNGKGGGIFNAGLATLTSSTLTGTTAGSYGGGIYNSPTGTLTMTGCTIANNITYFSASYGGGIYNRGTAHLYNCSITSNYARYSGGGLYNGATGTLTLSGSTITGNAAAYFGIASGHGYGGGLSSKGALDIVNSTINGNVAYGDYDHQGTTSTSYGAGVAALAGSLTITNSTISGNTAIVGGGLFIKSGATVTLRNTIVAGNNFFQTGFHPDVSGTVSTAQNNLIGDSTGSNGLTNGINGNQVGNVNAPINPLLTPLGNFGGPTQTMALLPGSPAIDAGAISAGVTTDQRGVARPQGSAPDIGAFESRGFVLTISSGNGQQTGMNTAFLMPLTVTVSSQFGEPVAGGIVTFTAPASGASASLSGATAIINASGQASVSATANGTAGTYQVIASASGAGAVAFTLTNMSPAPPPPPPGFFVVATDAGTSPVVNVYDATTGTLKAVFYAFTPSFTGGVRVALGDVNGDGTADIVCGAGPGGGPQVTVFDGVTFQPIMSFFALPPGFTGGVFVAAGDVNGDGRADVICGAGRGGGPQVTITSGRDGSLLGSFFAFVPSFVGGVTVAAGDINGDGRADIICGAGAGGGPQVAVFSGSNLVPLASFFALPPGFTGGVFVAAGDVNGDGRADIICGAGPGGGPQVAVFDGVSQAPLASFFALPPAFTGGVRVGYCRSFGSGRQPAILAAAGIGGGPQVTAFAASTAALSSFFAFDYAPGGGLFVSG